MIILAEFFKCNICAEIDICARHVLKLLKLSTSLCESSKHLMEYISYVFLLFVNHLCASASYKVDLLSQPIVALCGGCTETIVSRTRME